MAERANLAQAEEAGAGARKGVWASTDIRVESSFPGGTKAFPRALRDAAPGRTPFINSAKIELTWAPR
jgi:hypothetical protein